MWDKKKNLTRYGYLCQSLVLGCFLLLTMMAQHPAYATEVQEITSPYGFKAWMVEDHSLPILSIHLAFTHSGSAYDPEGKEGLAYFVAAMMTEGAGDLDNQEFKKRLEAKGIKLSVDVDEDTLYISVKTLTENVEETFRLLQDIIFKPRFDKVDLERVQAQIITGIAARKEDASWVAGEVFRKKFFGNHPYAHSVLGNEKSLTSITKEDLQAFTTKHFNRAALHISAVGDIRPKPLIGLLDTYFVELPLIKTPGDEIKEYQTFPTAFDDTVSMEVPQSTAVFGHQGMKRNDPDFYAAYLLNYILGSGNFESRLMKRVREENGLAYSVYTTLDNLEYGNTFQGEVASRNDRIRESVALIKEEIARLQKDGVTAQELKAAKQYVTGSFALMLDKNEKLANFLLMMQLQNLGIDYIDKRNQYMEAVDLETINRVAHSLFKPDQLVTVVIGKASAMQSAKKEGKDVPAAH